MDRKQLTLVCTLVEDLVKKLVDHPARVRVREIAGERSSLLEVTVARSDYGKVIGRGGNTATNLRILLACLSGRAQRRFTLQLLEPDEPRYEPYPVPEVVSRTCPRDRAQSVEARADVDPIQDLVSVLTRVVEGMVDRPDGVRFRPLHGAQTTVFELTVDPDDVRRVIGRNGRSATAFREILKNVGAREGRRYLLEIVEPSKSVGDILD